MKITKKITQPLPKKIEPRKPAIYPEIIRNYAPIIIPKIPELLNKLEEKDWYMALKIIHEKHKQKANNEVNSYHAIKKPYPEIEEFTIDFIEFMSKNDPELNLYTIQELSKIRKLVGYNKIKDQIDLEGIILKSIKLRSENFSRTELSQLHDILKNIYTYNGVVLQNPLDFFNEFLLSIINMSDSIRPRIIDHAYRISTIKEISLEKRKEFFLEERRELLTNYTKAINTNFKKLGNNLVKWSEEAINSNKSVKELIEYFKDTYSYFHEDLEKIAGGTNLSKIHGRLLAYVQALTGENIKIDSSDSSDLYCSFREDTFLLPFTLNIGKSEEDNFQIYKAIASYQAGAFMFGTYALDVSQINQKTAKMFGEKGNITNFFNSFENPEFAQGLFELLEFSRIDYKLREKFPGLRQGIKNLKQHILENNKSLSLLERIKAVVCNTNGILSPKNNLEEILIPEVNSLMKPEATVEKTVESVTSVYEKLSKKYDLAREKLEEKIIDLNIQVIERDKTKKEVSHLVAKPSDKLTLGNRFKYHEWDTNLNAYKQDFVQVVETAYPNIRDNNYVNEVLQEDIGLIGKLKNIFESVIPEEFEVVKKQLSGEVNYDLLVSAFAEKHNGITPSEKIYTREYKNNRSVTSMVFSENSGSLKKFLDIKNPKLRLVDIIKKSQIYFSEAIDAIGDNYALATFSGETEKNVEFYLIKDFEQPYDNNVKKIIGSMIPLKQNRDGAGIRHATRLLSRQPEKLRMLFYLMDGVPHDFGYEEEYAITDTKKAIIECKQNGCFPVVIAFGQNINKMIRSLSEHCIYREVAEPNDAPLMLPNLYRRLAV